MRLPSAIVIRANISFTHASLSFLDVLHHIQVDLNKRRPAIISVAVYRWCRAKCNTEAARRLLPLSLLTACEAIRLALTRVEQQNVTTTWFSAGPIPDEPELGRIDFRHLEVAPGALYRAICRVAGRNGWYAVDLLWRARGLVDL